MLIPFAYFILLCAFKISVKAKEISFSVLMLPFLLFSFVQIAENLNNE